MKEEIEKLNGQVFELQLAYEKRNKLMSEDDKKKEVGGFPNWSQLLSNRLTVIDKVILILPHQIFSSLQEPSFENFIKLSL